MSAQVGDWVRFYQSGRIVLGIVQYVEERPKYYPYKPVAMTDIGTVDVADILELRRVAQLP